MQNVAGVPSSADPTWRHFSHLQACVAAAASVPACVTGFKPAGHRLGFHVLYTQLLWYIFTFAHR